ncbi:MAG: ribonuclease III [Enterobacteriaceae bacterium]|nr:ribonuclease III [Enterobacteriaceae bacterium]
MKKDIIKNLKHFSENILKYNFKNIELLKTALTHKSLNQNNNERLEFLGDSILNFIITKKLYKSFPQYSEGKLTQTRSNLTKGNKLLELSNKLTVEKYILTGKSLKSPNNSIAINAIEAIIGAIYLDSNLKNTEKIINIIYKNQINENTSTKKDPKNRLQEYLQNKNLSIPNYTLIKTYGKKHNEIFLVKCNINDLNISVLGIGKSKKIAEKICAEKIIKKYTMIYNDIQ